MKSATCGAASRLPGKHGGPALARAAHADRGGALLAREPEARSRGQRSAALHRARRRGTGEAQPHPGAHDGGVAPRAEPQQRRARALRSGRRSARLRGGLSRRVPAHRLRRRTARAIPAGRGLARPGRTAPRQAGGERGGLLRRGRAGARRTGGSGRGSGTERSEQGTAVAGGVPHAAFRVDDLGARGLADGHSSPRPRPLRGAPDRRIPRRQHRCSEPARRRRRRGHRAHTARVEMSYDLLVVGGGINGAGIARDAAGRGLSVLLVERGDLAAGTSSASSKLIHGGLRYLEQYEFRLVAEALAEREILLRIAGHLAWPARFVMPHRPGLRPRWAIRLGLFLYDHLARRSLLPGSHAVRLDALPYSSGLKSQLRHGFVYSDCRVDDARLVIANAMDAAERGARILVGTECLLARREGAL